MAQGLFKTKEIEEQERLKQAAQAALQLWQINAVEYRVLPLKYLFLLAERRRMKLKPKKLLKSVLNEYPEVPFLQILEEDEATAYIDNMVSEGKLYSMIKTLEDILSSNYSYVTLRNWVKETRYELRRVDYEAAKKSGVVPKIRRYGLLFITFISFLWGSSAAPILILFF